MRWLLLVTFMAYGSVAVAGPWEEVAESAGLPVADVQRLAEGAVRQQTVLDRMAKPWEAKPWHVYAPLFLTDERVAKGRTFAATHAAALRKAEADTGVPASIILAIIGVETRFGEVMGNDRVLDALFTLGFHHEKRGAYFRKELGHFLRLCVDEGWQPGEPMGSYAGAMGYGQFMPSSYRTYAVDGDADGRRDLFRNPTDAIASVANYFAKHSWKAGEPVLEPATLRDPAAAAFITKDLKPTHTWGQLRAGVGTPVVLYDEVKVRLFAFETEAGPEYRLGFHNFYVITRYNHSALYARAVVELAARFEAPESAP